MINTFIKLTENDKRLIIVLLLVFILAFVIVGYLSLFIKKIMSFQAKRADDMLADVYNSKVITSERKLRNLKKIVCQTAHDFALSSRVKIL